MLGRTAAALLAISFAGCAETNATTSADPFGIPYEPRGGPARVARCDGVDALVPHRDGALRVSFGPGIHAVQGEAVACGRAPLSVRASDTEQLTLLDYTASDGARRATFRFDVVAEEPRSVDLSGASGVVGFRGLRVESVEASLGPTVPVPPPHTFGARPPIRSHASLPSSTRLEDWGWAASESAYGSIEVGTNAGLPAPLDGGPMRVRGRPFISGLGTHAPSRVWVPLLGRCRRFEAWVGVDDLAEGGGSVRFRVFGDDALLFESERMTGRDPARRVGVDVSGHRWLVLEVTDGDDGDEGDFADWAEAVLVAQ